MEGLVGTAVDWDSGDLGSLAGSASGFLCDLKQIAESLTSVAHLQSGDN